MRAEQRLRTTHDELTRLNEKLAEKTSQRALTKQTLP
jgi:hypothetical protein